MATVFTHPAVLGRHELIGPDATRARDFYAGLLGSSARVDEIGFVERAERPHWLVHFEVADVDLVAAKAQSLGGRVLEGPDPIEGVGRRAVLADPEGAEFAVVAADGGPEARPRATFAWDELLTTEVEAAKEFYREVLGWSVAEASARYWRFRAGESDVAGLLEKPAASPAPAWLTYLAVDDVDAAAGRCPALGGVVIVPPTTTEGAGRWAVLADPVGAVVGVLAPER